MVARGPLAPRPLIARSWDVLARDLLASHGTWAVHSVFRQALNLVAPDGELLGIVVPEGRNGPANVVLEPTPETPAFDQELEIGAVAYSSGGMLTISPPFTVDLRRAALWSPTPIRFTLPID